MPQTNEAFVCTFTFTDATGGKLSLSGYTTIDLWLKPLSAPSEASAAKFSLSSGLQVPPSPNDNQLIWTISKATSNTLKPIDYVFDIIGNSSDFLGRYVLHELLGISNIGS